MKILSVVLIVMLAMSAAIVSDASARPADDEFAALVFTKTAGYRHASIPDGIAAMVRLGDEHGFAVDATEDASFFTPDRLNKYDVVIFLSTSGDVLGVSEENALKEWVEGGHGLVGIHAAADTEYDWDWYARTLGAQFKSHPEIQEANIDVEDAAHPSTAHLPPVWTRTDEWYDYRANPRERVHVLMTLDESSYEGGEMGEDHPIAWTNVPGDGRVWYTGLGHTRESFEEVEFLQHVLGGILWAAGRAGEDVGNAR